MQRVVTVPGQVQWHLSLLIKVWSCILTWMGEMQHCLASVLQQDATPSCSSLASYLWLSLSVSAFPARPACPATACSEARLGIGGISSCGGSEAISRHNSTADGPLAWQIRADAPGPPTGPAAWLAVAQLTGGGEGEAAGRSAGKQLQPGTAPVMEPLRPEACLQALDAHAADSRQLDTEDSVLQGIQRRYNVTIASAKHHLRACRCVPPQAVLASCGFDDRCLHVISCFQMTVSMAAQPKSCQACSALAAQCCRRQHMQAARVFQRLTACCAGADSVLPRQQQQLLEHLSRQLAPGSIEGPANGLSSKQQQQLLQLLTGRTDHLCQSQAASSCEAADASSSVGAADVQGAPGGPLQAADADAAQLGAQAGHRTEGAQPGVVGSCEGPAGSMSSGASGREAGCDLTGDAMVRSRGGGAAHSPIVARSEVRAKINETKQHSSCLLGPFFKLACT